MEVILGILFILSAGSREVLDRMTGLQISNNTDRTRETRVQSSTTDPSMEPDRDRLRHVAHRGPHRTLLLHASVLFVLPGAGGFLDGGKDGARTG